MTAQGVRQDVAGFPGAVDLEADRKQWIKDIPTVEAEGHVWDDVAVVSCDLLRMIPDGPRSPRRRNARAGHG